MKHYGWREKAFLKQRRTIFNYTNKAEVCSWLHHAKFFSAKSVDKNVYGIGIKNLRRKT